MALPNMGVPLPGNEDASSMSDLNGGDNEYTELVALGQYDGFGDNTSPEVNPGFGEAFNDGTGPYTGDFFDDFRQDISSQRQPDLSALDLWNKAQIFNGELQGYGADPLFLSNVGTPESYLQSGSLPSGNVAPLLSSDTNNPTSFDIPNAYMPLMPDGSGAGIGVDLGTPALGTPDSRQYANNLYGKRPRIGILYGSQYFPRVPGDVSIDERHRREEKMLQIAQGIAGGPADYYAARKEEYQTAQNPIHNTDQDNTPYLAPHINRDEKAHSNYSDNENESTTSKRKQNRFANTKKAREYTPPLPSTPPPKYREITSDLSPSEHERRVEENNAIAHVRKKRLLNKNREAASRCRRRKARMANAMAHMIEQLRIERDYWRILAVGLGAQGSEFGFVPAEVRAEILPRLLEPVAPDQLPEVDWSA